MVTIEDLKLPPHNIEAEKGVISAVILDNEVIYILDGYSLQPEDFYLKEHQSIYRAIKNLWNEHRTIDVVTLSDELKKMWELENVWWMDYLYELTTFVITPSVAKEYWKIVKEKSVLRNILKTAQKIIWDVYEEKDINEILETIEKRIFDLTQVNLADSLRHIREILDQRAQSYVEIVDNPEILEKNKVMSNYKWLDEILGWFKPWELIILAARPSMWKTAFSLNLAVNAALRQNKSVAIFSLEMGSEQIVDRILSLVSEIPLYKLHKWQLDEEDFAKIWEAMEKLSEVNIYIDDRWGTTIPELKSKLRRLKIEKWQLDLVIIDYLQLMSWSNSKFAWNRVQEIAEISRWLKELARELKIPIIALSQLSRAVEQRPDKRPQLSDLRESWAIEQDADAVLMLYREDYYDPETDRKWIADIFVRKNRNWPVGETQLYFNKEIMKFYDIEKEDTLLEE
jgi:replicative DNA helicase